jgi:hypothetical protein
MTIDLLPFSAFALESCAAPAAARGAGQTLTVSLRLGSSTGEPTMAGRLWVRSLHAFAPGTEHAHIARTRATPLTITFPPAPAV